MKMKRKMLISLLGILAICLILTPVESKAALQANGNPGKVDTINNWMKNIRLMETTGGGMGLNGGVDGTNLDSTGTANNIDVHMEKNTEYGAMAILSASAYGKQSKIEDGQTTTGNKSGIYINLNQEWVAAGYENLCVANFQNAKGKYKNIYEPAYSRKIGDAIEETTGWHGSGISAWFWAANGDWGFSRACSGSVFSYSGDSHAHWDYVNRCRAVVVVGSGL